MKRGGSARRTQSGMALIALLVLLIMAGSFALYRSLNSGTDRVQIEQSLIVRMARAKDALVAYAVTDNKRPGRLLCPDLVGDGISPLLSRDDCDAYRGWLPWKTLDLGEGSDDTGSKLYYVLSPLFGGDRTTQPLNSDTVTSLRLDLAAGSTSNDIAALIIAPRGVLDTRNADGDDYYYSGQSEVAEDNDVVVALTRRELMAAVEKCIANELKSCLEEHAASAANTSQNYPWPAPLSNNIFKGMANSRFGMIPATQPGSNPDEVLKKSIDDLRNAKTTLESASTAAAQLTGGTAGQRTGVLCPGALRPHLPGCRRSRGQSQSGRNGIQYSGRQHRRDHQRNARHRTRSTAKRVAQPGRLERIPGQQRA